MKALIVDDQYENLYLVETILRANGFETDCAANGMEALEVAKRDIPDVIISDILMPVMDGFKLCREVKKDADLCMVPFVFYTATYTDPKDEDFALSLGADRFVLKPQEPDELMEIIQDVINKVREKAITKTEDAEAPEDEVLKKYNEVLIRKLEDKMQQLEWSERELRERNTVLKEEVEQHRKAEMEIKHTIEALRESEERFRSVTQTANEAIITVDSSGDILEWNRGAENTFGYRKNEVVGKNIEILVARTCLKQHLEGFKAHSGNKHNIGRTIEVQGRHKSGIEFPLELSIAKWETAAGVFFTAIIRDITVRKKSEKEINMLAHSIESIAECISITDASDIIIFVNDAFSKTYGYTREELIGQHISMIRPLAINGKRDFKDILPQTIKGGWKGEVINRKKDGTLFPVYLSTSVVKDEQANPIALIGVATDITELQKSREELILAKEKAEQADKLKSEFLAQMSHEIRTPINVIMGNVSFINDSIKENSTECLDEIFQSTQLAMRRIMRTVDLILSASEMHTGSYKPVFDTINLSDKVLKPLFTEYHCAALEKGIEFTYDCKARFPMVVVDEYSATEIFANLIDNAVKYTEKGKIEMLLCRNNEGKISVEIKDTGIGIGEKFLENIFKPFTQEDHGYSRAYDGLGLGLANVKKYCEMNYAFIEVESKKNEGSLFRVTFNRIV